MVVVASAGWSARIHPLSPNSVVIGQLSSKSPTVLDSFFGTRKVGRGITL